MIILSSTESANHGPWFESQGKKVRWEKFFRCEDLAKDLPPVIKAGYLPQHQ